jgi:hypothetical protein
MLLLWQAIQVRQMANFHLQFVKHCNRSSIIRSYARLYRAVIKKLCFLQILLNNIIYVMRFEVFMAVGVKNASSSMWHYILLDTYQHFGGTSGLYLQGEFWYLSAILLPWRWRQWFLAKCCYLFTPPIDIESHSRSWHWSSTFSDRKQNDLWYILQSNLSEPQVCRHYFLTITIFCGMMP